MAFVMMYVLVSPMVPTPNAVGKKPHSQTAATVPVVMQLIGPGMLRRVVAADSAPVLPTVEVIDLTCTRLC